jgi:hypothetical protein
VLADDVGALAGKLAVLTFGVVALAVVVDRVPRALCSAGLATDTGGGGSGGGGGGGPLARAVVACVALACVAFTCEVVASTFDLAVALAFEGALASAVACAAAAVPCAART